MRSIRSSEVMLGHCLLDGEGMSRQRICEVVHEAFSHGKSQFVDLT